MDVTPLCFTLIFDLRFVFATQLRYKIRGIVTAAAAPGYITLYHPQAGNHDCGLNDGGDLDHLDCCT